MYPFPVSWERPSTKVILRSLIEMYSRPRWSRIYARMPETKCRRDVSPHNSHDRREIYMHLHGIMKSLHQCKMENVQFYTVFQNTISFLKELGWFKNLLQVHNHIVLCYVGRFLMLKSWVLKQRDVANNSTLRTTTQDRNMFGLPSKQQAARCQQWTRTGDDCGHHSNTKGLQTVALVRRASC